jgi:hypothetical protein
MLHNTDFRTAKTLFTMLEETSEEVWSNIVLEGTAEGCARCLTSSCSGALALAPGDSGLASKNLPRGHRWGFIKTKPLCRGEREYWRGLCLLASGARKSSWPAAVGLSLHRKLRLIRTSWNVVLGSVDTDNSSEIKCKQTLANKTPHSLLTLPDHTVKPFKLTVKAKTACFWPKCLWLCFKHMHIRVTWAVH